MKKTFLFVFIAYIIALVEGGFMANFPFSINLLLIYALLFNLFEDPREDEGLIVSAFCGLFFDIFSSSIFGLYTIIFLVFSIILKIILKKYVRLPIFSKF